MPIVVGEARRSVVADLVGYTRDVDGRYLEVLLHPEIQMEPVEQIGWNLFQYNAGLTLQTADPNTRVLSFVFYHCRTGGGIQELTYPLEFYGRSIHQLRYWSVGLGDLDAESYLDVDNPMAWALASWMRHPRRGRAERRLSLLERILRRVTDPGYRRLLLDAVRSYFRLNAAEQAEEQRLLASGEYGEVREMLNTELSRLEERARQQGLEEGRQALQRTLVRVIRQRFPNAAVAYETQVNREQDPRRLEELIERALSAATVEEIWPSLGS